MRHEWTIRTATADYVVVRGTDVFLDEGPSELSPSEASARMPRVVLRESARGTVARWETVVAMLRLDGPALLPADRRDAGALARALALAFHDRRLVALAYPRPARVHLDPSSCTMTDPDPAPEPAPAPLPVDDEVELTWIEIELLDARGKPVPHEPYELVCADGERRTGTTDAQGLAFVDGVVAGACSVAFPGLDGREWAPK